MTKRWTPPLERYDLAGLTDAETGNIGRPLESRPWPIPPRIELDESGRFLRWYETVEGVRAEDEIRALDLMAWRQPAGDMLRRFAALADSPPQAFCAFARRWGLLIICDRHGLPISHNRVNTRGPSEYDDGPPCAPLNDGSCGFEPIAAVRD